MIADLHSVIVVRPDASFECNITISRDTALVKEQGADVNVDGDVICDDVESLGELHNYWHCGLHRLLVFYVLPRSRGGVLFIPEHVRFWPLAACHFCDFGDA